MKLIELVEQNKLEDALDELARLFRENQIEDSDDNITITLQRNLLTQANTSKIQNTISNEEYTQRIMKIALAILQLAKKLPKKTFSAIERSELQEAEAKIQKVELSNKIESTKHKQNIRNKAIGFAVLGTLFFNFSRLLHRHIESLFNISFSIDWLLIPSAIVIGVSVLFLLYQFIDLIPNQNED
jgi:galactokinase